VNEGTVVWNINVKTAVLKIILNDHFTTGSDPGRGILGGFYMY
jgi:hypothetical protein